MFSGSCQNEKHKLNKCSICSPMSVLVCFTSALFLSDLETLTWTCSPFLRHSAACYSGFGHLRHSEGKLCDLSHSFPHPGPIACCRAPNSRPPATEALHTICGNNTSIVSSSWWWARKCPKHVEHIISAIKHSVATSWFSSLCLYFIMIYTIRTEISSTRSWYSEPAVFRCGQ